MGNLNEIHRTSMNSAFPIVSLCFFTKTNVMFPTKNRKILNFYPAKMVIFPHFWCGKLWPLVTVPWASTCRVRGQLEPSQSFWVRRDDRSWGGRGRENAQQIGLRDKSTGKAKIFTDGKIHMISPKFAHHQIVRWKQVSFARVHSYVTRRLIIKPSK